MSLEEAGRRGQMHEEQANVESKHTASVPFLPGKFRAKRRTTCLEIIHDDLLETWPCGRVVPTFVLFKGQVGVRIPFRPQNWPLLL
ncbi:hypothetical protein NC651_002378 [Populus alba x Populus x berolinensis]|nr:hypothetical protein NC651_002378 [Populus alba x Populus x berolinensis]